MSYSVRVYLKHYLVDAFLIFVSAAFWFAFSISIGVFFDLLGNTTYKMWFYFWSGMYLLIMSGYTLILVWNFFGSIQYHRSVSKSKIGSAYERYNKNPKLNQSLDLLKDILLGLDWISFLKMNDYLKQISNRTISIRLEGHTWKLRDRVFRPTPQIQLIKDSVVVTKLYIR